MLQGLNAYAKAAFCLAGVGEPSLDLFKPLNAFLFPSFESYAINFTPYSLKTIHS